MNPARRRFDQRGDHRREGDRREGDRGSGTVLVLGLVAVVIGLCWLVTAVGASTVARHRAESAADLAALAAAVDTRANTGFDSAPTADCAAAGVVAAAVGGVVVGCRALADGSVVVEVTVSVPWLPELLPMLASEKGAWSARARARAGFVDEAVDEARVGESGTTGLGSARPTAEGD